MFAREFDALVQAQHEPAWIAYTVPAANRESRSCCGDWNEGCCSGCRLEGESGAVVGGTGRRAAIPLEGSSHINVLYRVEQRAIGKIRFFSADCTLDAGGLVVHWLTGVRPADSVALLERLATDGRVGVAGVPTRSGERGAGGPASEQTMRAKADSAVAALANHGDAAADAALDRLVDPKRPENIRRKAVFWISAARGQRGLERLFEIARRDASGRIRGEAIFWLGQKAGQKAAAAIRDAVDQDPELEVKKKAVFALSRLPAQEGVPLLISVARTHRQPDVRRQAMFWLGQSKDPRALAFFEEVLR